MNTIYYSRNKAAPFVPKAELGTDLVTGEKSLLEKTQLNCSIPIRCLTKKL